MCSNDENSRVITYVHTAANTLVFEPCFRLIVCLMAIFSNKKINKNNHRASFYESHALNVVEAIGLKQFISLLPINSVRTFRLSRFVISMISIEEKQFNE